MFVFDIDWAMLISSEIQKSITVTDLSASFCTEARKIVQKGLNELILEITSLLNVPKTQNYASFLIKKVEFSFCWPYFTREDCLPIWPEVSFLWLLPKRPIGAAHCYWLSPACCWCSNSTQMVIHWICLTLGTHDVEERLSIGSAIHLVWKKKYLQI